MISITLKNLRTGIFYPDIEKMVLGEGAKMIKTEERERKAFQRVVGDLALTVSNIDKFWTNLFANALPTERF